MNMQILGANFLATDAAAMHLGFVHDSFISHMFPLNQLLRVFLPDSKWLIVQS